LEKEAAQRNGKRGERNGASIDKHRGNLDLMMQLRAEKKEERQNMGIKSGPRKVYKRKSKEVEEEESELDDDVLDGLYSPRRQIKRTRRSR